MGRARGRARPLPWVASTLAAVVLAGCSASGTVEETDVSAGPAGTGTATATATADATGVSGPGREGLTMRSLVEGFVLADDAAPGEENRRKGTLKVVDLTVAGELVDLATTPEGYTVEERRALALVGESRFDGCLPYWLGLKEVLGWNALDAEGVVVHADHLCEGSPRGNTLVRGGPASFDPPPAGVAALEPGLFSLGHGEDFVSQPSSGGPRYHAEDHPVRFATQGEDVFVTMSTTEARAWLDPEPEQTVGSDPAVMQVVDELDRRGVFAMTLAPARDPVGDLRDDWVPESFIATEDREVLIRQPCEYVALGSAVDASSGITTYAVYRFPDREASAAALASVRESWTTGNRQEDATPVRSVVGEVRDVDLVDELVVVTLDAGSHIGWMSQTLGRKAPLACAVDGG